MCGIVGIFSYSSVVEKLYDSLIHLQHRGQDAAGMVTSAPNLHKVGGKGLVRDIFDYETMAKVKGNIGLAHVRYTTSGSADNYEETQPFLIDSPYEIAIVHNGHLSNTKQLVEKLQFTEFCHLNTNSDSEILLNLFASGFKTRTNSEESSDFFEQVCQAVSLLYEIVKGSYSVISLVVGKGLIAYRDPYGIRPLIYGVRKLSCGKLEYIFASEPTMFHALGFKKIRSLQPGEVIYIDGQGCLYKRILDKRASRHCIFEYIYFARLDSKLDGIEVYHARVRMGQNLALLWRETCGDILPDIVIPVPSTANTAALAFANQLGVRYAEGIYVTPFVNRTFIMPKQTKREKWVGYKFSAIAAEVKDKKVLMVDDSIVRGTTSKKIVNLLRQAGAKEIYLVSVCSPIRFPCRYGIDMANYSELIAAHRTHQEIKEFLGVDKLLYQTIDDLLEAVACQNQGDNNYCLACCDGLYPV